MNHRVITQSLLAGALTLAAAPALMAQSEGLPTVPADEVEQAVEGAETGTEAEDLESAMADQGEEMEEEQVSVPVTPGVNEIVPVAINHLNRVLVPFPDPQVRTTSGAEYQIHDRAIYVSTQSEAPVTMYVTNGDDEQTAISLTLVPRRVAPVEVSLSIRGESEDRVYGNPQSAGDWETSQPYVDTLRDLLREVAVGEVPQGYSLADVPDGQVFRGCNQPGLEFDFSAGQYLSGQKFQVHVGVAHNESSDPVEFVESNCSMRGVTAVAAWPRTLLRPDERTEVYVVERQITPEEQDGGSTRPSLVEE